MQSRAAPPHKIADIERLRGVAILLVVLVHLPLSGHLFGRVGLDPMRIPFWLAVHLFFVISGYVVMKSFVASGLSVWRFYVRRVFRLWPVLLAFFAFSALVNCFPTGHGVGWGKWLKEVPPVMFAYFTVHLMKHRLVYYNSAMWSLSVEEQFYLIAPALLVLLWYVCRGREKACNHFFVGAYLAITALRLALVYDTRLGLHAREWLPWAVQYLAIWQFDFIVLGVLLYFRLGQPRPLLARLGRPLQCALAWACLALPFLLMYQLDRGIFLPWDQSPLYPFGLMAAGLGFYAVVGFAALDRDLLYTHRFLDRILLYWGSRSYGIYVFHFPILALTYWLAPSPAPLGYLNQHVITYEALRAALALGIGLPVIEVLYRYVEQPGINLGRRLIRRLAGEGRQRGSTVAAPAPAQRAA